MVSLGTVIQQKIAVLLGNGYNRDAAVYETCIKSPENYSLSLLADGGDPSGGGTKDVAS